MKNTTKTHNTKHNRKYEKSERAIQSAILKLLKTHRGRITAKQVAKVAGVSRQTIYNHHPNINQAITNNEAALLAEFSAELDTQIKKLSNLLPDRNGRIFYAVLIFMARHRELFCPICSDANNHGLLFRIMESALSKLEVVWLPVGTPAPEPGSERISSYLDQCVGVLCRWGARTSCDVARGDRCVNTLLRTTADAVQNRST